MPPAILSMFQSKRFATFISGVLVVIFHENLDVTEENAKLISEVLISWMWGDTIRPKFIMQSRRFWLGVGAIGLVLVNVPLGFNLEPDTLTWLIHFASGVMLADAYRRMEVKPSLDVGA